MIDPGHLDRRLTMQARTLTKDSDGAPVESWADAGTIFAQALRTTGTELETAGAPRSRQARRFRVRYRAALEATAAQRFVFEGRVYELAAAYEDTTQARRAYHIIEGLYTEGQQ